VAIVNEVMCDIFTENSNVQEMSTESVPESEETSTDANHSFPADTSRNSEVKFKSVPLQVRGAQRVPGS